MKKDELKKSFIPQSLRPELKGSHVIPVSESAVVVEDSGSVRKVEEGAQQAELQES